MRSRSLELPAAASPLPLPSAPCAATVGGAVAQVFRTGFYVRVPGPSASGPAALLPVLGPGALLLPTGLRCPGLDAQTLADIAEGVPVTVETDAAGLVRRLACPNLTLAARRTWRPSRVGALAPVADFAPGDSGAVTEVEGFTVPGPVPTPRPSAPAPGPRATVAVAARAGTPGLLARGLELVRALEAGHGLGGSIRDLLGFGPGSTPSGDDLLCGAALALRGSHRQDRLETLRAHLPAHLLFGRTSALSASLVLSALDGHCLPQVAVALRDLVRGDVPAALASVQPIGHSSGADLLLGATLVLSGARSLDGALAPSPPAPFRLPIPTHPQRKGLTPCPNC